MTKIRKRKLSTARMSECYPSKEEARKMSFEQYVYLFDKNCRLKPVEYTFGNKK